MKRYTPAQAKQQFSSLLDAAEQGESVIIERRGVRFCIRTERPATPKRASRLPMIEMVDPAVVAGNWTWDLKANGLEFVAVKRGRR
jgi:antitoxin (DNA-binding transcriptional repressor) of toxin-antitoxin stability system